MVWTSRPARRDASGPSRRLRLAKRRTNGPAPRSISNLADAPALLWGDIKRGILSRPFGRAQALAAPPPLSTPLAPPTPQPPRRGAPRSGHGGGRGRRGVGPAEALQLPAPWPRAPSPGPEAARRPVPKLAGSQGLPPSRVSSPVCVGEAGGGGPRKAELQGPGERARRSHRRAVTALPQLTRPPHGPCGSTVTAADPSESLLYHPSRG